MLKIATLSLFVLFGCIACGTQHESTTWQLDNLEQIGGHAVEIYGNPKVVETPYGKGIAFDGIEDQLIVDASPLKEYSEFTIEALMKPNDVFPENAAPRFFHIESSESVSRLLMEIRLNDQHQWYFDGFLKATTEDLALIDSTLIHPTEAWMHVAVSYQDSVFTTYVNHQPELSGAVRYDPIPVLNGKTSLGARMNFRSYFNGTIAKIRVTNAVLKPEDFMPL
ncbi:LamG domain-containing protein [Catalinimonas alkaloidigena]|nr:LamG domain-containing protein [Catalinimonas alkaloidigena]